MNLKTPLNLPDFNWNKILVWSASALGISLVLALLLRIRFLIIALEGLDALIIIILLCIATVALIKRYSKLP